MRSEYGPCCACTPRKSISTILDEEMLRIHPKHRYISGRYVSFIEEFLTNWPFPRLVEQLANPIIELRVVRCGGK